MKLDAPLFDRVQAAARAAAAQLDIAEGAPDVAVVTGDRSRMDSGRMALN